MNRTDAALAAGDEDLRAEPLDDGREADQVPEDQDDDEMDEVAHQGQVYQIPKALKGAFLMQADYTRKTQELAEHRRAVEADRQGVAEHAERVQATIADRAQIHLLDQQLAGFEDADWAAMGEADPQQARALWAQFQETRQLRDRYAWALTHHEHRDRLNAEREAAAQLTHTGQVLSQKIEGWSPQVAAKLVDYAGAFGVSLEELRQIADPRLWMILHRAHAGDQAARQQTTAQNVARVEAVRPAISVAGGGAPSGAMRDEMATGDWMKRRNDQMRRGR